ncbi:MAG: glycosyltransferase family 39 protein [Deltaproteobacteria bacterium]|nr:glycosyltransferase family 39 protein [Deltaproteobacteria bacterium]MBW2200682.1 glycosyltransferase family 39 protein [Deltaproteobacteria bacterium]
MNVLRTAIPESKLFYILVILAFFSLFPLLGQMPLFDEDEGYYAEVTREMLESGNYVTAYLNGRPEYDKPILLYWCMAISFKVFGLNEFGARFPSALATLIWALALFFFVRRHLDTHKAFLAALFLISSIQITITGKAAIADALLNLFMTLSMFNIYDHLVGKKRRHLYLAFLFIGLGFLTKGPVAVVVPVVVSFFFCMTQGEVKFWLRSVFNPVGILIFIAVAMPWYVLEYMDQGQAFIQDFIFKHNLERFQRPFEGHSGSFFYYIPVIIIGTLPYAGLIFPLIKGFRTHLFPPVLTFGFIWFLFVLIFFSLAGTKLPHYVIYGYPPLFMLYACVFEKIRNIRIFTVTALIFLFLLAVLPALIPAVAPFVNDRFAVYVMSSAGNYFGCGYYVASGLLIFLMAVIAFSGKVDRVKRALMTAVIYLVFINLVMMPRMGDLLQSPVKEAAMIARARNYHVVMWGHNLPSFIFYGERFVELRNPMSGDILITKKNRLEELAKYEIQYEKNGIVLAKVIEP